VSVGGRLAGFAAVLVLAFGGGAALGAAVGPIDDEPTPAPTDHHPQPPAGEGEP
jgi:hypothetical protein